VHLWISHETGLLYGAIWKELPFGRKELVIAKKFPAAKCSRHFKLSYTSKNISLICYQITGFRVLCTKYCQFLWIVHIWLALRYSLTFIWNMSTSAHTNIALYEFNSSCSAASSNHNIFIISSLLLAELSNILSRSRNIERHDIVMFSTKHAKLKIKATRTHPKARVNPGAG
jgi:hypothetical protein